MTAKQKDNPVDITLCCFEKPGDFCHRYQVGEEVVQKYLPELWGGEIGTTRTQLRIIQGGKLNLTYPPKVLTLIGTMPLVRLSCSVRSPSLRVLSGICYINPRQV